MDLIQSLSRTEMKSITAGYVSAAGGCHKCCWDHDDDNCSECNDGTICVDGAHTHQCADSECDTVGVG